MRAAPAKKNGKRLKVGLEFHFRLYDEYDRALCLYIKQESQKNERSVQQQVRVMLRKAAEERV